MKNVNRVSSEHLMSREMLHINKCQRLDMKYTEAAIFSFYQKYKNYLEYLVEGVQMAR